MATNSVFHDAENSNVGGLSVTSGNVSPSDDFGESGDVFNHKMWRPILAILWSFDQSRKVLLGLFTLFLLRGKSIKIQEKNKVVVYNVPLPPAANEERQGLDAIIGTGINFPLKINFPNESSKVPANSLTLERFKCVARAYIVPELLKSKRFPSTAESIGLGNLIRSLMQYETEPTKAIDSAMWKRIKDTCPENLKKWLKSKAAAAGTISSKEIYDDDERMFSGCVAWSGIMALMTDAANKIRAPSMPKDVQTQFERSAFYPDFKRKMAAKNIKIPQSGEFVRFLNLLTDPMSKFLKTATGLTSDESAILDKLMSDAQGQTIEVATLAQTDDPGVVADTPNDIQMELLNHAEAIRMNLGLTARQRAK